ncbi:putative lipoate--protein ligase [Sugiyamaella lignohabitans]|uniref:Putative lipoate-protein ligase A n=1 Tax=Sugiyamaella lignohabitans TaxID=796027 RepID=A0A161HHU4_9ASCO|nr:putative lipoate--protein ligase [Sugiyamaella lignohabitans]ANB15670.1 putative lipoate--protein ligase [Sugiyamaella lignohabitans]
MPREEFTRDKHAQMVIDALNDLDSVCQHPPVDQEYINQSDINDLEGITSESLSEIPMFEDLTHAGIGSTRAPLAGPQVKLKLNERYDIVTKDENRKVSGSAYKIERQRAYHHGTMLLHSRLDILGALLHRDISRLGVIEGRGVASVKSPVTNIGCHEEVFMSAVVKAFQVSYYSDANDEHGWSSTEPVAVIDEKTALPQSIIDDAEIMKTWEWQFGQTPEFTHRISHPETDISTEFIVNRGRITKSKGVSARVEGLRYCSEDLYPHFSEQSWILGAIDGFSGNIPPGMTIS